MLAPRFTAGCDRDGPRWPQTHIIRKHPGCPGHDTRHLLKESRRHIASDPSVVLEHNDNRRPGLLILRLQDKGSATHNATGLCRHDRRLDVLGKDIAAMILEAVVDPAGDIELTVPPETQITGAQHWRNTGASPELREISPTVPSGNTASPAGSTTARRVSGEQAPTLTACSIPEESASGAVCRPCRPLTKREDSARP